MLRAGFGRPQSLAAGPRVDVRGHCRIVVVHDCLCAFACNIGPSKPDLPVRAWRLPLGVTVLWHSVT
jgi:hypothetical protein